MGNLLRGQESIQAQCEDDDAKQTAERLRCFDPHFEAFSRVQIAVDEYFDDECVAGRYRSGLGRQEHTPVDGARQYDRGHLSGTASYVPARWPEITGPFKHLAIDGEGAVMHAWQTGPSPARRMQLPRSGC